jgi:hypothetical protein
MLPLPEYPYELAQWGKAKVQPNCHIVYQHKFYSVPFEYLGEQVDVRATQLTIEVFYHHQRITSHKRLWGKANYSTMNEHMPPEKLFFADWDKQRFLDWSSKIGQSTRKTIEAILDRAVIEQQAYRSCFGVLSLKDKYSAQRLERACSIILSRTQAPTYQQLKGLLEKNIDLPANKTESINVVKKPKQGFQRGAEYFGGNNNVK